MDQMDVDNDTRGWIMCIVSGIACVAGASIICVDLLVRYLPGKSKFSIQESNVFLACSLSLSFGVMLFSSLYSMLPSAKQYLKGASYSDQDAGFILMACFSGGFFGIQTLSRVLHQFMPSHVVDCDHTHDEAATESRARSLSRKGSHFSRRRSSHHIHDGAAVLPNGHPSHVTESTPLLPSDTHSNGIKRMPSTRSDDLTLEAVQTAETNPARFTRSGTTVTDRRSSMIRVRSRLLSFMKDTKSNCDETGPCYGYSDPCGQECFKHLGSRTAFPSRHPTLLRTTTGHIYPHSAAHDPYAAAHHHARADDDAESTAGSHVSPRYRTSRAQSRDPNGEYESGDEVGTGDCSSMEEGNGDVEAQHHHHVPTNAFLSLGLQTSLAIALHKFPEGFITYATNHANPSLGFNVFMALFVHNITEGFAMALPLYMALGSRLKAMLWSSFLGGLSQPLGAGIAVLWFKLANHTNLTPNAVAYACMFAVTAGIMVSVALQLFVEALSLNHNRNLCMFFAFLGMVLLGLSSAIAAKE